MRGNQTLKPWMGLTLASAVVSALVLWQTAYWSRQIALDQIGERSRHTLSLIVQALRGDLEKFRYLPKMLGEGKDFRAVLLGKISRQGLQGVNEELERINNISGALDTYLMDATGLTVAASNWASKKTFIDKNFNYRPYFKAAMEGRLGRYFALGTTSGERGYYFAYPVRDGAKVLGAVVVKIQMDHHERAWRRRDHEVIVVDRYGVLFLSSKPNWHFRTLAPLSADSANELLESRRYGSQALLPLSLSPDGAVVKGGELVSIATDGEPGRRHQEQFLVQEETMSDTDWRVVLLARTERVEAVVKIAMAVATVLLISVFLAITVFYQRRRRLADRILFQEESNAELEKRVLERTTALTEMNIDLQNEIAERERAEDEVRKTQATLVQAAKMAALGQMSAGLSHELNQPLAAIRSYADNARTYLDRDRTDTARDNLNGISELTDRMARIIRNLRTYAREETIDLRPTSLGVALDESLILMGQRISNDEVRVFKTLPDEEAIVLGGDVRLQQIFVNLISNALDAMVHAPLKEIRINVTLQGEDVVVDVGDSGPGIQQDMINDVFDPFRSSKEVGQGMGLGLSITYGLINQFGGSITVCNGPEGGALFTLRLKKAEPVKEAVA